MGQDGGKNDVVLGDVVADGAVVRTISESLNATDIFKVTTWRSDEAAMFLVGIHKLRNVSKELDEMTLLDGRVLRDPQDTELINQFWDRCERVRWIFNRTKLRGKHRVSTFMNWARSEMDVCCGLWIDDAVRRNYFSFPSEIPKIDRDVKYKERVSLYRLIIGLMYGGSRLDPDGRDFVSRLKEELERQGVGLSENTVRDHVTNVKKYRENEVKVSK